MIGIDVRGDLAPLHRAMVALGSKQVPFAMSLALNDLARGVAADQVDLIDDVFDSPTPFTEKAYRIEVATKSKPVAVVAAKDIQAQYLRPYVEGGARYLGTKRGMLAPRGVALNRYGNLTRGKMASLQSKPNVFVGRVATRKSGTISGVWQRPSGKRNGKGALKLLIQFEDTTEAPKRLPFYERAQTHVRRNAARAFSAALQRALATARS